MWLDLEKVQFLSRLLKLQIPLGGVSLFFDLEQFIPIKNHQFWCVQSSFFCMTFFVVCKFVMVTCLLLFLFLLLLHAHRALGVQFLDWYVLCLSPFPDIYHDIDVTQYIQSQSTYPGSNCQRLVVINLVTKCPLSMRMQQLFVLGINLFVVWTVFIPVTLFRSYLC